MIVVKSFCLVVWCGCSLFLVCLGLAPTTFAAPYVINAQDPYAVGIPLTGQAHKHGVTPTGCIRFVQSTTTVVNTALIIHFKKSHLQIHAHFEMFPNISLLIILSFVSLKWHFWYCLLQVGHNEYGHGWRLRKTPSDSTAPGLRIKSVNVAFPQNLKKALTLDLTVVKQNTHW